MFSLFPFKMLLILKIRYTDIHTTLLVLPVLSWNKFQLTLAYL